MEDKKELPTGVEVHTKIVDDFGAYLNNAHSKYLLQGYKYIAAGDQDSSFFSAGKLKALEEFDTFFLKYYDSVNKSYKKQINK
jgi:hypothetical protein